MKKKRFLYVLSPSNIKPVFFIWDIIQLKCSVMKELCFFMYMNCLLVWDNLNNQTLKDLLAVLGCKEFPIFHSKTVTIECNKEVKKWPADKSMYNHNSSCSIHFVAIDRVCNGLSLITCTCIGLILPYYNFIAMKYNINFTLTELIVAKKNISVYCMIYVYI